MERARRQWFPPKDRWFRLSLVAVCVPVLLLVLFNLFLALPWARKWVARKVGQRIGLTASIGSLSWWPWEGLGVGKFVLVAPAEDTAGSPLLRIDRITVDPRWTAVLRGRKEVESIRLQGGEIVLDPRLLIALVGEPSAPVQAPAVTLSTGDSPSEPPPPLASEARPDPTPVEVPAPPEIPEPQPIAPAPDSRPPMFLEVEDLDFRVVSQGRSRDLLAFRGFKAHIPVQGADAGGSLSVRSIEVDGVEIAGETAVPLRWQAPELRVGPSESVLAGIRLKAGMRLARVPGLPFAVECSVEKQDAAESPLPGVGSVSFAGINGGIKAGGLLQAPSTWQGVFAGGSNDISLPGKEMSFFRSSALVVFQGGVLFCPDIRLVGERLSLLANGAVSAGGATGVLRVVLPQDTASAWSSRLETVSSSSRAVFTDLGTPDRTALDLRWASYDGRAGVALGPGGTFILAEDARRLLEWWLNPPAE